jgi:four helix bundle protein
MGSASEVECQLMLSKDLQYIDSDHYQQLHAKLSTIKRRTNAFIQKLKTSP